MTALRSAALAALTVCAATPLAGGDWPQWGGPGRDFQVTGTELAETWPFAGPPVLWRRPLGEGYSAIVVGGDRLYTQHRDGEDELVVALSADTGETLWEHRYGAPTEGWTFDRGAGPHATPALAGGRLFTVGATGVFHALDAGEGSVLWSHDLLADFDASFRHRGYSSSPLLVGELVLVPVGGGGRTVVAFRQDDGTVAWRGGDDDNSYSSPVLIEIAGRRELVVFGATEVLGLDPGSGRELWRHPHPTRGAFNISTPVWSEDGLLFVSSAYDGGSRVLRLADDGGTTRAEELWFSNQMRVHFGTAIRIGDVVYASSGDFGPAPMTAVDVRSGDILWRDRSFAKHSLVRAGDELVLLDEDGVLGLVRVSREGPLEVLARTQLFDGLSWTVPTLVGTTLYARDRREIVAVELGAL